MKHRMYLDGKYIDVSSSIIQSFTPGVFQAKGVFETLRADDHTVHFINEHQTRMNKGLRHLKIKNPLALKQWQTITHFLLNNKGDGHLYFRIRWMVWQEGKVVHHAVIVLPYKPPTARQYQNGLKICVLKTQRVATATMAYVKSLNYSFFADAYQQAVGQGFDDALLINKQGHIFESTKANVLVLIDDQLFTPPLSSGCLAGITRQQMIEMGRSLQMNVKEKNITLAMLKKAKGIYLTNSLFGLIPVDLNYSKL